MKPFDPFQSPSIAADANSGAATPGAGRPLLKICGVTEQASAIAAIEAGADLIGLNLWPRSKRFLAAGHHGWAAALADRVPLVGVFVNTAPGDIAAAARALRLSAIQLHGDESPAFAASVGTATGLPVIKALGLPSAAAGAPPTAASTATEPLPEAWRGHPWLLLDAHDPVRRGGTGRAIDWDLAARLVAALGRSRVLLAGGLHPGNAAEAVRRVRPWAIDVASGAETAPGLKDPGKVAALAAIVRA